MKYDSDYSVRLATLAAMSGDTSVYYPSVYDVDLAILRNIEEGGGGTLDYNQIKTLLAASGITEIKVNGTTSAITLDYAEVSKISTAVQMYDNSQKKIRVMSVADYENLPVKDDNIIYYLTEN